LPTRKVAGLTTLTKDESRYSALQRGIGARLPKPRTDRFYKEIKQLSDYVKKYVAGNVLSDATAKT